MGIPRCDPEIMLNDRSNEQTILESMPGTNPQDSQRQTGYRNRFMSASITRTIRSHAQLQCDFWRDPLDEFGYIFIRLRFLIRRLVSQVFYEFLRHSRPGISGFK